MKPLRSLAVAVSLVFGALAAHATDYVFANPNGGSWSDPTNWSPAGIPTAGDTAVISGSGARTITVSSAVQVGSLTVGGAGGADTLEVGGFQFTVGTLATVKSGGAVKAVSSSFSGPLKLESGGLLSAVGAVLSGSVDLAAGASADLSGCTLVELALSNAGKVVVKGFSSSVRNGATGVLVTNSGLWDFSSDLALFNSGGPGPVNPRFVNLGEVRKSAGPGSASLSGLFFENAGLVSVLSGSLQVDDLGSVLRGNWNAAANSSVRLTGNFAEVAQPAFGGAGRHSLVAGSLVLPSSGPVPNLALAGGTVRLPSDFQGGSIQDLTLVGASLADPLPVTGSFSMSGGSLSGSLVLESFSSASLTSVSVQGTGLVKASATLSMVGDTVTGQLTVTSGGRLELSGCALYDLTLSNAGAVVQKGSGSTVRNGTTGVLVTNSGLWDLAADTTLANPGSPGPVAPRFVNLGEVRKSAGPGGASISGLFFENAGLVSVLSGILQVDDLGSVLRGNWNAAANTFVRLTGSFSEVDHPAFEGAGQYSLAAGNLLLPASGPVPNLALAGGTVRLPSGFQGGSIQDLALVGASLADPLPVTGSFNMSGGLLSGSLVLESGASASLASVSVQGTGLVRAGSTLSMSGDTVTGQLGIEPGGRLELSGCALHDFTLSNAGTVVQKGNSSFLRNGTAGVLIANAGLWDITADVALVTDGGTGPVAPRFVNTGVVRKSGGTGGTGWGGFAFEQLGDLEVRRGVFALNQNPVVAPSSVFRVVIAGPSRLSDYGVLQVPGPGNLGGILEVVLSDGYQPSAEPEFDVVAYGQPGSPFTAFTGDADQFTVRYDPVRLVLRGKPGLQGDRPPLVTLQPVGQTAAAGTAVVFTTLATGSPAPDYQWQLNGRNLPGETRSSITVAVAGPESGGVYTCVVANALGAVVTDEAVLSVPAPALAFRDRFSDRGTLPDASGVGVASNAGATREAGEPLHAGERGGSSVWADYLAPASGTLELSTVGSTFDTLLAVYSGDALGSLVPVASDDDGGGFYASRVRFAVTAGTRYAIAVDGRAGVGGGIVLRWTLAVAAPPPPRLVSGPASILAGAGSTVALGVVAADTTSYQWYRDGRPLADGGRISGANGPTLTIAAVTPDDVGAYAVELRGNGTLRTPSAALQLDPGIGAGNVLPVAGTFDKFSDLRDDRAGLFLPGRAATTASRRGPGQPSGLARGKSGTLVFGTRGSAGEQGEPPICGVPGGASQWFEYLAELDGELTLDTRGSTFPTLLAAYIDDCDDCDTETALRRLTPLGCDADGQPDRTSRVTLSVTNGSIYTFCVDGVRGASGRAVLNYRLRPNPPKVRSPKADLAGRLQFRVEGSSGAMVRIEMSTDLKTFVPVTTVPLPPGGLLFTDTSPASETKLFRAVFP